MPTWYLINNVQIGTDYLIAGSFIDDVQTPTAPIAAAGGILVSSSNLAIAAAAAIALAKKLQGVDPAILQADMLAAYEAQQQIVDIVVASSTALAAVPATARQTGTRALKSDDRTEWVFDALSAEAASEGVIAPLAGTGRWIRSSFVTSGAPMINRLRVANAGGGGAAIAAGNTVIIGGITFEFRAVTPPAGGTAGRIWVFNGANAAASLANLIDAVNHVIDAARITYNGVTPPNFLASAGLVATDMVIRSATAPGGTPVASATATATTETLADAPDVWDQGTCYSGTAKLPKADGTATVALTAAMITKGSVEFPFTFLPRIAFVWNRNRQNVEAYAVGGALGNRVSLTLAGGAPPNNQAADVIDVLAFE